MNFADLRPPVGARLQLDFIGRDYKHYPCEALLVGFMPEESVLVRFHRKPLQVLLYDGMSLDVRLAMQSGIVQFRTTLTTQVESPLSYLHLSWPVALQFEPLRRNQRFPFQLALEATARSSIGIATARTAGRFVDISPAGARVALERELSSVVTQLDIAAQPVVAGARQTLQLTAEVKRNFGRDARDERLPFHYGLAFPLLTPAQRLLMLALCHELQGNSWGV
jgi:hypothetical protein